MEAEIAALSVERRERLSLFREVTADARDVKGSLQLLESCDWDVERALQLHLTSVEEDVPRARPAVARSSSNAAGANADADLREPLLAGPSSAAAPASGTNSGANEGHDADVTASRRSLTSLSRYPFISWLARGFRRIGASVFSLICSFILGPSGLGFGGGRASGAEFSRMLASAYGNSANPLVLPRFFDGSFVQALQAARRDLKLLVVYIHSDTAMHARKFCTEVLGCELIQQMLDESFVTWGGDIARMETHHVAQLIRARNYPCLMALLPTSADEVRVVGAVNGDVQVDAAFALLTSCLEEMDTHRSGMIARQEQHTEDRHLREQQDREYQEALEIDRQRKEQQRIQELEEAEAKRLAEEKQRSEEEEVARLQQELQTLEERRRQNAAVLETPGPEATARLAMRLPAGQRIQRKFRLSATLDDVYAWADCCAYLPEHASLGLQIPRKFALRTSFPSRDLAGEDSMSQTVEELQLAGTNIMLVEVEDDD